MRIFVFSLCLLPCIVAGTIQTFGDGIAALESQGYRELYLILCKNAPLMNEPYDFEKEKWSTIVPEALSRKDIPPELQLMIWEQISHAAFDDIVESLNSSNRRKIDTANSRGEIAVHTMNAGYNFRRLSTLYYLIKPKMAEIEKKKLLMRSIKQEQWEQMYILLNNGVTLNQTHVHWACSQAVDKSFISRMMNYRQFINPEGISETVLANHQPLQVPKPSHRIYGNRTVLSCALVKNYWFWIDDWVNNDDIKWDQVISLPDRNREQMLDLSILRHASRYCTNPCPKTLLNEWQLRLHNQRGTMHSMLGIALADENIAMFYHVCMQLLESPFKYEKEVLSGATDSSNSYDMRTESSHENMNWMQFYRQAPTDNDAMEANSIDIDMMSSKRCEDPEFFHPLNTRDRPAILQMIDYILSTSSNYSDNETKRQKWASLYTELLDLMHKRYPEAIDKIFDEELFPVDTPRLVTAINEGHLALISWLAHADRKPNLGYRDGNGNTLLHVVLQSQIVDPSPQISMLFELGCPFQSLSTPKIPSLIQSSIINGLDCQTIDLLRNLDPSDNFFMDLYENKNILERCALKYDSRKEIMEWLIRQYQKSTEYFAKLFVQIRIPEIGSSSLAVILILQQNFELAEQLFLDPASDLHALALNDSGHATLFQLVQSVQSAKSLMHVVKFVQNLITKKMKTLGIPLKETGLFWENHGFNALKVNAINLVNEVLNTTVIRDKKSTTETLIELHKLGLCSPIEGEDSLVLRAIRFDLAEYMIYLLTQDKLSHSYCTRPNEDCIFLSVIQKGAIECIQALSQSSDFKHLINLKRLLVDNKTQIVREPLLWAADSHEKNADELFAFLLRREEVQLHPITANGFALKYTSEQFQRNLMFCSVLNGMIQSPILLHEKGIELTGDYSLEEDGQLSIQSTIKAMKLPLPKNVSSEWIQSSIEAQDRLTEADRLQNAPLSVWAFFHTKLNIYAIAKRLEQSAIKLELNWSNNGWSLMRIALSRNISIARIFEYAQYSKFEDSEDPDGWPCIWYLIGQRRDDVLPLIKYVYRPDKFGSTWQRFSDTETLLQKAKNVGARPAVIDFLESRKTLVTHLEKNLNKFWQTELEATTK